MTPTRSHRALTAAFVLLAISNHSHGATALGGERTLLPVFADTAAVNAYCDAGLAKIKGAVDGLTSLPLETAVGPATLIRWDTVNIAIEDVGGPIAITSATSPHKEVREAAEACELKVSAVQTDLFQNAEAYERVRRFAAQDAVDAQIAKVALEGFEDAGITLSADKRARAKAIFDRLDALGIEFARNSRDNLPTVAMTPADLEGMPQSYLDTHKPNDKGVIELKLNYPDYIPFVDNAMSSEARRRYYMAFNQIGGERNLAILNEASQLRKELATLFGKPSFAHQIISRRMAGSPERVTEFLATVKQKVQDVERTDLDILRAAKAELLGRKPEEVRLERWDTGFYTERVRKAKYAIDQNALRSYFPTEASISWLFDLAQRMYGVKFVAGKAPVWHDDVRYYDVFDANGRQIAGAYFDPFPRDGKYNHAAVWPVRGASTRIGRLPISVLVTNLDRKGLDHRELETLLHEFGHLLHGTLSNTKYTFLAGTGTRRDFVEAPSQMFEEWARNVESLALIRNHCKDCPVVDKKLLDRLVAAKRFGAGIHYSRQYILAAFDMAMAGPNPGDPMATYRAIEEASPQGHTPGTMFPARFGHLLGGYAAGYYGYMWSEVLALDMASAWKGKLLDPKMGRRYLDKVLSRGGEGPADALVRDFLGREPSPEPFFAQITGKR